MRISQKDRKRIAELINTCIVWTDMINYGLRDENSPIDGIRNWMVIHNKAGRELNDILQVPAITLYKNVDTGEEY